MYNDNIMLKTMIKINKKCIYIYTYSYSINMVDNASEIRATMLSSAVYKYL